MKTTTTKWNKFELYQESVQNAPFEVEFIRHVYKTHRKKEPLKLREDFCGTGLLCAEWVKQVPRGDAVGIDLDGPTLRWGQKQNVDPLGDDASRVRLVKRDVMTSTKFKADVIAALNFSYFVFKKRTRLKQYFQKVHRSLLEGGVLFLDLYGGPQAQVVQEESTEQDEGFDYVWDQDYFNPITCETKCYIHFDLPDGTRIERAFTYDWRLWSIPELEDLLAEVGFKRSFVYWEGTDEETSTGNGEFEISREGDDAESWVAYIVALK